MPVLGDLHGQDARRAFVGSSWRTTPTTYCFCARVIPRAASWRRVCSTIEGAAVSGASAPGVTPRARFTRSRSRLAGGQVDGFSGRLSCAREPHQDLCQLADRRARSFDVDESAGCHRQGVVANGTTVGRGRLTEPGAVTHSEGLYAVLESRCRYSAAGGCGGGLDCPADSDGVGRPA